MEESESNLSIAAYKNLIVHVIIMYRIYEAIILINNRKHFQLTKLLEVS